MTTTVTIAREGNVFYADFRGNEVRVLDVDGEPQFIAADVCRCLGITWKGDAGTLSYVPDDEKGSGQIRTPGGPQTVRAITEAGLYTLIMRSDKPEAREFQDWVTREVLPAIRKTGGYMLKGADRVKTTEGTTSTIPLPATFAEALRGFAKALVDLAESEEKKAEYAAQVDHLTPKAEAFDDLMDADGTLTTTAVAAQLKLGSAQKFNDQLHEGGIIRRLGKKWLPTAAYVDSGFFKVVALEINGYVQTQMRWTPKGIAWARENFCKPDNVVKLAA